MNMLIDEIRRRMLEHHAIAPPERPVLFGKRPTAVIVDELYPPTLLGMRINLSRLCERKVSAREHKQRMVPVRGHWITGTRPAHGNYHARIQKKWDKRYGFKTVHDFYIANDGRDVFLHPECFAKLTMELFKDKPL